MDCNFLMAESSSLFDCYFEIHAGMYSMSVTFKVTKCFYCVCTCVYVCVCILCYGFYNLTEQKLIAKKAETIFVMFAQLLVFVDFSPIIGFVYGTLIENCRIVGCWWRFVKPIWWRGSA